MFFVYILKSQKDGTLYYGFSTDLKTRVASHNSGLSKYTSSKIPWKLIYYEAYINEQDARAREKFLKSGIGREVIKKHLTNTLILERCQSG